MRRDMDLIRQILQQVEAADPPNWFKSDFNVDGYDAVVVARHVELLAEAGLLKAHFLRKDQSGLTSARVERLTWMGYEFLEAARDESLYKQAKEVTISKSGGLAFDLLKEVLISFAKAKLFGLT